MANYRPERKKAARWPFAVMRFGRSPPASMRFGRFEPAWRSSTPDKPHAPV
jgi:hypothetical protein